jgi:hypothetical protein
MADEITGISLRDVRELLEQERKADTKVIDAASMLLDVLLLISAGATGPDVADKLIGLFEAKNALVELGRKAIEKFAKPPREDYQSQARRLVMANCLLTYVAYFEALQRGLPELMKHFTVPAEGEKRIGRKPADKGRVNLRDPFRELFGSKDGSHTVADLEISVPHPASLDAGVRSRIDLYEVIGTQLLRVLAGQDEFWARLGVGEQAYIKLVLNEDVPALANRIYREFLVGLAIDYPQFLMWLVLSDQELKTALLERMTRQLDQVGTAVADQSAAVIATLNSATGDIDLGLKGLGERIDGLRQLLDGLHVGVAGGAAPARGFEVAAFLHGEYERSICRPVIADRSTPSGGPRLVYPKVVDCYVPQAYRQMVFGSGPKHLEQDSVWKNDEHPVTDDLGEFVLRHLESLYSSRTPLLILGHPGSGKSLFTEVLAARLAYPAYTTVRVELRKVSSTLNVSQQIEQQIRLDTDGEVIAWSQFARSLPTPPVIILDGYDELLQATGSTQADYLDRVRQFQEDEAGRGRPVRVIVTSRITLIDKVTIPVGTTIVRLEDFDKAHRRRWITVWNDHNQRYFAAKDGVQEFELPDNPKLIELAGQPLLLLMLAIYDSADNELRNSPDIDQTRLYYDLVVRFIRRELEKDEEGYCKLDDDGKAERVARELERLGVAAIGMANRQALATRREDLNDDLAFFKVERDVPTTGAGPLSQADLLVGSFLFIHESRTPSDEDPDDKSAGPATYEFLHKTFGEFLTADFLLAQVLAEAEAVAELAGISSLDGVLRKRLDQLNSKWFACLVYTPLHAQPNVLLMLKEWAGQRPATGMSARPELRKALNRIVVAQLRRLLTASTLPDLGTQDRDIPYEPLAILGHVAIYTLNLVVLHAYVCDGSFVLDESDLGDQTEVTRPWDRLAALWRAWFPPASLAALTARMTVTREGAKITIKPSPSPLAATETRPLLAAAYNASLALADDLTTASLGLHLMAISPVADIYSESLRERVKAEAPDLLPLIDTVIARTTRRPVQEMLAYLNGGNISYESGLRSLPPGLAIERAEVIDRLYRSPAYSESMDESRPDDFASLSRYSAEVAVSFRLARDLTWLPGYVLACGAREWRSLLGGPAAVPVLREARRQFGGALDPTDVAREIHEAMQDEGDFFDVETAAEVAIVAWRGGNLPFCSTVIGRIVGPDERDAWRLRYISTELWGDLADLFRSAAPEIERHRAAFAELAAEEVRHIGGYTTVGSIEVHINAMRIGALIGGYSVQSIGQNIDTISVADSFNSRRLFLLLLRLVHERPDLAAVAELFRAKPASGVNWRKLLNVPLGQTPATVDVEALCLPLSYQEAMDLQWAIGVARREFARSGVAELGELPGQSDTGQRLRTSTERP